MNDDSKNATAAAGPALGEGLGPNAQTWTCFHCGEVCTDAEAARLHFGTSEHQQPGCQIDLAEYRRMEEVNRRHCEEDTELHRELNRMEGRHQQALRRAEDAGYAKGLAALKAGWKFERIDGGVSVVHASGMGAFVREKAQGPREIPEEVLHALALDLGA